MYAINPWGEGTQSSKVKAYDIEKLTAEHPEPEVWLEHLESDLMKFWNMEEAKTLDKGLFHTYRSNTGKIIADIIDYVQNPQKTDGGRLISSYECESRSVDEQFMLTKHEYERVSGRGAGKNNVLAYHIRQSFKPGEVSPEEANEIGRKLALSFTKGKHAFVVCTHIDKAHTHNHIVFNSTSLDYRRKFKNYRGGLTGRVGNELRNGFSVRWVKHRYDRAVYRIGLPVCKNADLQRHYQGKNR